MTDVRKPTANTATELATEIGGFSYIEETLRLPDLHMKAGMEAPSSFVAATRGKIVPHLVSESINDGMGLLVFDVEAKNVSNDQTREIIAFINRAGALSKLKPTRYSWTPEVLEAACRGGAAPLIEHYGLPDKWIGAIEDGGMATPSPLSRQHFLEAVPRFLRSTKLTRSEIGLNFGGNHFLEVQAVDEVLDHDAAASLGVSEGQLAIMYHLGPGPLGSMLSNLYAFRTKPQIHRKIGYAAFRQLLHASRGWDAYRQFGGLKPWMAVDADTDQGKALANVLDVIKNYGFGYRMGTVRAIVDAVGDTLGTDDSASRLVVDLSHNMIQPETIGDEEFWVSRHNCCRPVPSAPGIVAGNHQASSCLTISPAGCDDRLGGFDHGVGYLLDQATEANQVVNDRRNLQTERLFMTRGQDGIHRQDLQPLLDRTVLDGAMSTLAGEGFANPVAYLRPIMTLKHKT